MNCRVLVFAAVASLSAFAATTLSFAQVVEGEEHCVVNVNTSDVLNVRGKSSATSSFVTTLRYGKCGIVVVGACQERGAQSRTAKAPDG